MSSRVIRIALKQVGRSLPRQAPRALSSATVRSWSPNTTSLAIRDNALTRRFYSAEQADANIVEEGSPISRDIKNFVKLRGLPYRATPEDIIAFFEDLGNDLTPANVHIVTDSLNRPSGIAYVQFATPELTKDAVERFHMKHLGRRYIEVFESQPGGYY